MVFPLKKWDLLGFPASTHAFPPQLATWIPSFHHASQDAKIDASEFLQIQLLRTGKVDRETLEMGGKSRFGQRGVSVG